MNYQSGMTQTNQAALPSFGNGTFYSPLLGSLYDPSTSLAQQAAVAAYLATSLSLAAPLSGTPYGVVQTVNTLRWNTLSVSYSVPPSISRRLSLPTMQIALQGSNLALWTNYRGKDPNVSASAIGNTVLDNGQLPQPRSWQLRITVGN
jgi:hypothetical protein